MKEVSLDILEDLIYPLKGLGYTSRHHPVVYGNIHGCREDILEVLDENDSIIGTLVIPRKVFSIDGTEYRVKYLVDVVNLIRKYKTKYLAK